MIAFEPTAEQQKIIDDYKAAIDRADKAIKALADDARIKLKDGSTVTGKELKEFWAKTDFVIRPPLYNEYKNKSGRGEADYNDGDPVISMNIDVVADYAKHLDAGLNYLILHEVGHMTKANRDFDTVESNSQDLVEQMANDIARAIAHSAQIPVLPTTGPDVPEGRYSTSDPLIFEVPSS